MLNGERTRDAAAVLLYDAQARWWSVVVLSCSTMVVCCLVAWSVWCSAAACWVAFEVEGGSGR
ncbi:allantoin permease [Sesbania bispinosa]|nr:allantoin permease [Sesbania bispinosa]